MAGAQQGKSSVLVGPDGMGGGRGEEDGQKYLKDKNPQQTKLSTACFVLLCFCDVNFLYIPKASGPLDHMALRDGERERVSE